MVMEFRDVQDFVPIGPPHWRMERLCQTHRR